MKRFCRWAVTSLLVAYVLTVASVALAANTPAKKEPDTVGMLDYKISMGVVLLGFVLGFIVVLKPSNRREREKPAQYEVKTDVSEGH